MLDSADSNFLSVPDFLKATPSEEAGRRFLYLEASNEARDFQGEVVLAKALADSASYYARYGNLDIQHRSVIGLAAGDPKYHLHEIGRPVDVKVEGGKTFVKGEVFSGDTPVAACANDFWDSITKLRPAQRWYPSVGGQIQDAEKSTDPKTGSPRRVIKKVRWTNIGFSRTPVNPAVPTVSTVPFGVLAKCWGAEGLDLTKALEAGYGTDVATLEGGGALRKQSLDHHIQSYWDLRDKLAGDIRTNAVKAHPAALVDHTHTKYGIDKVEASKWVERFLADLKDGRSKRAKP